MELSVPVTNQFHIGIAPSLSHTSFDAGTRPATVTLIEARFCVWLKPQPFDWRALRHLISVRWQPLNRQCFP